MPRCGRERSQEDLREAFFDETCSNVTAELPRALQRLDIDQDGEVRLQDVVAFGLARNQSTGELTGSGSILDGLSRQCSQQQQAMQQPRPASGDAPPPQFPWRPPAA